MFRIRLWPHAEHAKLNVLEDAFVQIWVPIYYRRALCWFHLQFKYMRRKQDRHSLLLCLCLCVFVSILFIASLVNYEDM